MYWSSVGREATVHLFRLGHRLEIPYRRTRPTSPSVRPSEPGSLNDEPLQLLELVDSIDGALEAGSEILGARVLGGAEEDERGEGGG